MTKLTRFLCCRAKLARSIALSAAIAAFVFGTATAALKLRVSDGTTTVTIVDNGPGDLSPTITGQIVANVALPNYVINVHGGNTKPVLGSALDPEMDLLSVVSPAGQGVIPDLTVDLSDTGYLTAGPVAMLAGNTQTAQGSVTFKVWADPANGDFTTGGVAGVIGPVGLGLFSKTAGTLTLNPYSIHEQVVFHSTAAGGVFSTDFDVKVSPEGSSLAMLAMGLAPLGLAARRRKRGQWSG
jgi:hypothetical protein